MKISRHLTISTGSEDWECSSLIALMNSLSASSSSVLILTICSWIDLLFLKFLNSSSNVSISLQHSTTTDASSMATGLMVWMSLQYSRIRTSSILSVTSSRHVDSSMMSSRSIGVMKAFISTASISCFFVSAPCSIWCISSRRASIRELS